MLDEAAPDSDDNSNVTNDGAEDGISNIFNSPGPSIMLVHMVNVCLVTVTARGTMPNHGIAYCWMVAICGLIQISYSMSKIISNSSDPCPKQIAPMICNITHYLCLHFLRADWCI